MWQGGGNRPTPHLVKRGGAHTRLEVYTGTRPNKGAAFARTREIKKDIPFEYRKALAEDLWSIILADTKRTDDENSFMRTCIKLIGVNDVDSAKARQAVINRIRAANNSS